jgi:5-formyltetrahydrofolate cyclo-ligase
VPTPLEVSELRKSLLARLRALSPAELQARSHAVIENFFRQPGLPGWRGCHVALYRSISGEVALAELEGRLAAAGAFLHFPRVTAGGGMEMVAVGDFTEKSWKMGPYGLSEPHPELRAVDPGRIEVIIVPGVAFGRQGERIGRGKGHYDRFLPQAPRALKIALCLDDQLFARLDQQPWDMRVDWVISETRAHRRT